MAGTKPVPERFNAPAESKNHARTVCPMTRDLDPRLNAYRPDIADETLLGSVKAERFVVGTDLQVTGSIAPVRRAPRDDAPLDTEALHGEIVRVFEMRDGWA